MDIGSLIRNTRKAKKLNLEQLALMVGTDSGNLSRLERGIQGASQELLAKILDALELSIADARLAVSVEPSENGKPPSKYDYAVVKQYLTAAECGAGYHNDHVELSSGLAFKRDWLSRIGANPENLAVLYASGDSMEPYIFDGDVVLFDTSDIEPKHNQVYVVRRPDCSTSIKRLILQISGDWIIRSDNPDRSDEKIGAATIHEIPIIGRVIWRGGNMG